ncbi:hypothetical protein D0962_12225 [Leptolyngbyaceae cyanobacterium CCMR0082]|nr:hypothetical protein [Adonisia turfae CCMR0082]
MLWCPWCGHENRLPEKPLTGDDFIDNQKVLNPSPGQIYRHYKHNPAAGKWHEYEVVVIVEAGQGFHASPAYFTAIHTESGSYHDILPATENSTTKHTGNKHWAFPELSEPHVCYKSTQDNSDKYWLRPLSMFTDKRFTLVS